MGTRYKVYPSHLAGVGTALRDVVGVMGRYDKYSGHDRSETTQRHDVIFCLSLIFFLASQCAALLSFSVFPDLFYWKRLSFTSCSIFTISFQVDEDVVGRIDGSWRIYLGSKMRLGDGSKRLLQKKFAAAVHCWVTHTWRGREKHLADTQNTCLYPVDFNDACPNPVNPWLVRV